VLFANRLAPVQVNYLGYPGTMGGPFMDYLIADAVCVPKASEGFYDEKIVRLPDSYQVNDSKRAIAARRFSRADLGLPENGVVLCCFNQSYKLAPESFDIWMRVLKANERAVLWLFESSELAQANLKREAAGRGVAAERLVFAPRMPLADHLARHAAADLFVDTFAYNAHTTASDALWAGLPVVTLLGKTFAGRVCASLLRAVGLPELITHSRQEYEATLLDLAADPERRAALKAKLAANRTSAPLFNAVRFARHVEMAYLQMHERAAQGLAPDHIDIAPMS
jgi:predicted O-linked N-acetylglucosamine transferase (SPINDLY family)